MNPKYTQLSLNPETQKVVDIKSLLTAVQSDTADKNSDSERKFSEGEEQQYSLMVLQAWALCSLARTYIFHFFRIRHGVDRMSS